MSDITIYQSLCSDEYIIVTKHCKNRCVTRDISIDDIERAILSGTIIEDYPDDTPLPSALILGYSKMLKPLHLVVSTDGEFMYIITAYFPDRDIWEDDFKTRRERNI